MAEESSGATMSCRPPAGATTRTAHNVEEEMLEGVETEDSYLPFPGFVPVSLYCLPQTSPPRTVCLRMITNPWFERISMMVILLNCVTLGMYQPCIDDQCNTRRCEMLKVFDHLIFAFFAVEMVIKMTAMGITGKKAYLADTWNRLDCFIVVAGLAEYCLDVENMNLSAIRTIRVLRPLRAINRIPSMRILVMLLLDTLPMLGNVLLLCFFVFFIFGIVGVQLWAGTLRQRCFMDVKLLPENVSIPWNYSGFYVERMRVLKLLSTYYQGLEVEKDYICSLPKDEGMHRCENLPMSRHDGMVCNASAVPFSNEPTNASCVNWNQYYTDCRAGDKNPFQGAISFDNIGLAWVAIFLVISLEGWTDIMYYVQDSHSFWDWIYFVLLIVIGSFFMINLCLVVIATQFSETKKREMERMRMERTRYQSTSTLASNSMSEPNSCYHEIIKYLAHLWRRAKRKLAIRYRNYRRRHGHVPDPEVRPRSITLRRKRKRGRNRKRTRSKTPSGQLRKPRTERRQSSCSGGEDDWRSSSPAAPRASPEVSDIDPMSSPGRPTILRAPHRPHSGISSRDSSSGNGSQRYQQHLQPPRLSPNHLAAPASGVGPGPVPIPAPAPASTSSRRLSPHHLTCQELLVLGGTQGAALAASIATGYLARQERHLSAPQLLFYPLVSPDALYLSPNERGSCSEMESGEGEDMVDEDDDDEDEDQCDDDYDDRNRDWPLRLPQRKSRSCCITVFRKFRAIIKAVVDHRYFQRGILLAILVNTLSMGIEYHNQPKELTLAVEISNVVFSAIFAFEMLLKLIGEGPYQYIGNGFNVFDGVIVILSLIELSQKNEGTSGLSVLRTFRLLRILKLVRFLPALRRQLFVMLRTMDNVAVFFALLILFIFIFSILGMNLFGCKFCKEMPDHTLSCERKNFDSLLWAIVTVFQILTQEDWNVVLFNGMERTSHWAALYFVALMTFGNYVLFNLLVAILVEGFSAERHECEINERRHRERELEDDKKRSRHSLIKEDEEKKESSDGKDSDPEKVKDYDDDPDPKCNIAKETKLLHRPPAVAITRSEKCESKSGPPIITHTAATPQGSPNATLEPCTRDLSNMLSPVMAIGRLSTTSPNPSSSASSHNSSDKALNNSHGSSAANNNSKQVSPSKQLAVVLNDTHSPVPSRRGSLSPTVDPTIRLPSWGRGSLSPSPCRLQRKDSHGSTGSSPRLQRRESRGSICSWRRRNRRRTDRETIVDSDTDSDVEADHEVEILNNSCHLNNCQPGMGPVQEKTKSHCNGGLPTIHSTPNNKRCILTQQNSIKSPPQTPRSTCAGSSSPVNLGPIPPQGPGISTSPGPLTQSAAVVAGIIPGASTAALTFAQGPLSPNHTPLGSSPLSWCPISRQNSTKSSVVGHCDLSPQNSISSGYKPSNLEMVAARCDVGAPSLPLPLPPVNPLPQTAVVPYEEKDGAPGTKICWYFETPAYLIERETYSLYCFPSDSSFRILCTKVAKQKWFDYSVLFFIALNCVTLAMERPNIPPESSERRFLTVANYIFTFVFSLEMFVKVVAFGLWYGHHAYFRNGWNVMDGSLVIISLVDVLMSVYSSNSPRIFGILRVFRLLRSLRPLRVINRAPGLKLVVQTLLSSLRPIGNIVLICCTFFIIFGILGVQLFKGTFYYCDGPQVKNIRNRTECENDPRNVWLNRKYNFDDLCQALMALFVLSSKDGWVNIMYQGLDAVGVDQQPIENYSEWRLLYFISFLLLVGFFVLNMFVGVVVENFHRCREEQEKEEKARRAEKRMKKMEKRRRSMDIAASGMREPPYYINYSRVRLFIHSIVTSKYFDLAIAAVIGLNVVTMAMEFHMMPLQLTYALEIFNYFFTAVFVLEAAMKMLALGAGRYFSDKWNQLDVLIVVLSVVGIVLEKMESTIIPINPTIIRVMRVLRIARVLKLLKMAKGIRALLDTVMQALPQVGNLGLLFFLLFFIFAALGVELFGRLECDDMNPCQGLGEHAHFRNFGMAFLTLFRVATGDNWNGIMKDTLRDTCDSSAECVRNCCVSAIITPLYFVIFVLMAQFVLVNVVVAVLMKHLEESHKHMEDDLDLDAELERELAAEVDMAVAAAAALENMKEQEEVDREIILFPHKPVYKMASLPANFTFNLRSDDQISEDSPSTSPSLVNVEVGNRTLLSAPSTPSLGPEDLNNVNIRQASPEEPVDKVAVANLRTIQDLAGNESPGPAIPQWHVGSFLQLPVTECGNSYRLHHRSVDTDLDLDQDQDLDLELWSPDGATTGKTEGSSLAPPPYPASSPGGGGVDTHLGTLETSGTYENIRDSIFDEAPPTRSPGSPVLVVVPSRAARLASSSPSQSLSSLSSSSSSLSSPPSSSHRLLPHDGSTTGTGTGTSTNGTSCGGGGSSSNLSGPSPRRSPDMVFADDDDRSDEDVMVVDPGMNTILCYYSGTSGEPEDAGRHLPVARFRNNRLL